MRWYVCGQEYRALGVKGIYSYGDWGGGAACVYAPGQPMKIMFWDEARAYCEAYDIKGKE